eukprot:268936-Pelagomonas_calceolata.AAC.1
MPTAVELHCRHMVGTDRPKAWYRNWQRPIKEQLGHAAIKLALSRGHLPSRSKYLLQKASVPKFLSIVASSDFALGRRRGTFPTSKFFM